MTSSSKIECYMCSKDADTLKCSRTNYPICQECFNYINFEDFYIEQLEKIIHKGDINGMSLYPQLSYNEEEYANKLIDDFKKDPNIKIICYGSTSWGYVRHHLYKRQLDEYYIFYTNIYKDDNFNTPYGLRSYI